MALLTAGYSVGQILGPLAVTPLLHHGYHQALLLAAAVVLAAAAAAALLRVGFPHATVVVHHAAARTARGPRPAPVDTAMRLAELTPGGAVACGFQPPTTAPCGARAPSSARQLAHRGLSCWGLL